MDLKNLITENKIITAEYPSLDGFKVQIAYLGRDKMKKLADRATTTKFNTRSKVPEEDVDNDLFLSLYVKELIKGWEGLKVEYLIDLLPVDISEEDADAELEYSEKNALELMKSSPNFDNWVSIIISDIGNFNKSN